jgi:hypothetical protein
MCFSTEVVSMLEEQHVRGAVRSVLDQPAPPAVTSLDAVVRRGRRRALVLRAGRFGGVVAAVAVIGVGATALRGLPSGEVEQAVPAGATSSPTTTSAASADWPQGWTAVSVASRTDGPAPPGGPPGTAAPGNPGLDRSRWGCDSGIVELPPPTATIRPEHEVVPAFEAAVSKVVAPARTRSVLPPKWDMHDPKLVDQRGFVAVDVIDATGTGSVQLEVIRFGGTALQNADADAYSYGNCTRPARKTLHDGTILQMYPINTIDPQAQTRPVRIYTPGGREYIATAAGYSSARLGNDHNGTATTQGDRGSVPLTTTQLAQLAEELAKLG